MNAYIDQYGRYIAANTLPPSDIFVGENISVKIGDLGNNAVIYVKTENIIERHVAHNLGSCWSLNNKLYPNAVEAALSFK